MSFKTEIEAIVGDIDSPDYTAEAVLYLKEGVKFITKYVMANPLFVDRLTSTSTLNGSGATLTLTEILSVVSVTRTDGTVIRNCIRVHPTKVGLYGDANSIYYTSKLDPKYYIETDILKVLPTPTNAEPATVYKIQPDTSIAVTDTSLSNFPDELERGVILYTCKELLRKFLSSKNAALPANMSIPSTPSAASVATVTVGSLGSSPSYSKTSLSLTAAPTIANLTIGATAPSAISLSTVVYVDPSAGDASATAVADVTIGSVSDANVATSIPSYSKPTTTVDYAAGSTGVDDWITDEDPEMAAVALEKQSQLLTNYQLDIQNELNEFNKDNVRYAAEVQEELAKHNTALQRAVSLAQIQAADAQQTAQQATQVSMANKAKDLQISMETRAKDMESLMANNQSLVADYSARVQLYQAQVNDEVQQYQLSLEKELGLFNTKRNTELQKHQNDIQDELNEFQKDLAIYQADLQQKIEQAGVSSQKEAMEIQNYATEVESYGQQVVKEIQNFTTKLQKLTTDYEWYSQQYQIVQQDLSTFLQPYMLPQLKGDSNETTAND